MTGKTEQHDLMLLIKSRNPLIGIETHEERRVIGLLENIANSLNKPLFSWDVVDGLKRSEAFGDMGALSNTQDPEEMLKHIFR